jgi:peptidyl-prolyl cis-trans isomerase SurA
MKNGWLSLSAGLLLVLAAAWPLAAQQTAPVPAMLDRVVAVVGDSIVLASDVEEELVQLQASGQVATSDPQALQQLRRQILDEMVSDQLLVQAALRDSLSVSPEEVESAVRNQIANLQRNFPTEAAFEQELRQQLGLSLLEYRNMLAREYQRNSLRQQYLQTTLRDRRPPPVSESEIRIFFEEYKPQLGQRPATVSLRQIVVAPQPSDSARAEARRQAQEVLRLAQAGEDFAVLARRFSQDPGSREQGGDLGWQREGHFVPAFERAVFSMRPGTISNLVETTFGFHIIKLERVRGAERQARHILIAHDLSTADSAATRQRAEEVARRLRAGESVDALVAAYGHPDERVAYDNMLVDQLPPEYAAALAGAQAGQVVGPIPLGDNGTTPAFAVVRITGITPAGEYTLTDVRAQIRQRLEQEKLLQELIEQLRRETFVDIRL